MLIAFLLFALCLIERRAKERMNNKAISPVTSKADSSEKANLAQKLNAKKRRPDYITGDTTDNSTAFRSEAVWNMPLNATILANP
jgi:CMP-N-acetylneuraminic acid synthetase